MRLTKVEHLARVMVMTSDTFFIEEIYPTSSLKNTSVYYLVNYFSDDISTEILKSEGFSNEEAKRVVEKIGGVPWMLMEVTLSRDPFEKIEMFYKESKARLVSFLVNEKERGSCEKSVSIMRKVLSGDIIDIVDCASHIKRLSEAEILFYDPTNGTVRFQTKLDEIAARDFWKYEKVIVIERRDKMPTGGM